MWRLAWVMLGGCSLLVDPPQGEDTLVNSIADLDQGDPAAAYANERYLVVWQDNSETPPDTSGYAIRGRFVGLDGVPLGLDILINDPNNSIFDQEEPDVAANSLGIYVVWTDTSGRGGDPSTSVKGRFIASTGELLSPERLINSTVDGIQQDVAVAATGMSAFVVVWTDQSGLSLSRGEDVRGRVVGSTGELGQPDFIVNANPASNQAQPAIARGPDGGLMVVWTETTAAGSDIRGRLLSAAGTPFGPDIAINSTTAGSQLAPSVAATSQGYLVAWTDQSLTSGDIDGGAVRGRFFDAAGTALSDDFLVNTTTAGDQQGPHVEALFDGSLLIAFEDERFGGSNAANNVRVRRFGADGQPLGDDFVVHAITRANQEDVAIAADDRGGALVVWEDESTAAPDTSGDSVRSIRLPPMTGN